MSCCLACWLLRITLNLVMYGYPAYLIYMKKAEKPEKKWVLYFLIFGIFNFLEFTVLFIFKWIFSKICLALFPAIKSAVLYWVYSDSFNGVEFIEANAGKYIDLAFENVDKYAGKILPLLGYPKRECGSLKKKEQ